MDQDKKQNPQHSHDPNRQGQQQQHQDPSQHRDPNQQDQRRQPGSNPQEGQKDRKSA